MKNIRPRIILLLLLLFVRASAEEPNLIDQINSLWKLSDYGSILQAATTEASKPTPLPESYAVLFGYNVFVVPNHTNAVQALDNLISVLQTTNPDGHQAVLTFKSEFLENSNDGTRVPTTAELDGLHQLFPEEFPIKSLLMSFQIQTEDEAQ